jgi:hypothetical protein
LKEVSGLKNSQGYDYVSSKILNAPFISSPLNYTSIISGIIPTHLKYSTVKP